MEEAIQRWRGGVQWLRGGVVGPGACMLVRVPHLEEPVNMWVRWLLWRHQMFPFLSEQGGHGADR